MYERFTDRARKVFQLANQAAQQLNHEYIGTEHILVGLIKEGAGIAAQVLVNIIGRDALGKIEVEVYRLVQEGPPMMVSGKLPQTPRAKKVVEYAMEEARTLNHNYVGTEHILLGLLREDEGVAGQVLKNLGLGLEGARREMVRLMEQWVAPNSSKVKELLAELKINQNQLASLISQLEKVMQDNKWA